MENKNKATKKTILIVDDEKNIMNLLVHNLTREGYETLEAYDGVSAIEIAKSEKPDLILLDRMLPKKDGNDVCQQIKSFMNVPIIMVSAKSEEMDKIIGLELGADDYITKPFSIRELIARVKANLRKNEVDSYSNLEVENKKSAVKMNDEKIVIGDLEVDLKRVIIKVRGEKIDLTIKEFEVLKYLAKSPGQVVTRELLLEKVWGYEYYGDIRTVDVTVRRIRQKIEKDTTKPKILITKRGIGYYISDNQ